MALGYLVEANQWSVANHAEDVRKNGCAHMQITTSGKKTQSNDIHTCNNDYSALEH